ncbi:hypothetical protein, partial [Escherichia coli]|uniref:hypothetical protein n=2 Tax=Escherichia coli TaxID=562 RepID=UPI002FC8963A
TEVTFSRQAIQKYRKDRGIALPIVSGAYTGRINPHDSAATATRPRPPVMARSDAYAPVQKKRSIYCAGVAGSQPRAGGADRGFWR